jgi:hypothetical protein
LEHIQTGKVVLNILKLFLKIMGDDGILTMILFFVHFKKLQWRTKFRLQAIVFLESAERFARLLRKYVIWSKMNISFYNLIE